MLTTTKRYKTITEESSRDRQLSGLFNIISSNLLLLTEVLSSDYRIKAVQELESLSRKARVLAKELISNSNSLNKDDLAEKISTLKQKMLKLVVNLTEELSQLHPDQSSNQKAIEDFILAKRLLRDSQRGLVTIQD